MTVNMDGDENLKYNFKPYERVENPLDSFVATVSTPDLPNTRCGSSSRSAASVISNEGFFPFRFLPVCVCVVLSCVVLCCVFCAQCSPRAARKRGTESTSVCRNNALSDPGFHVDASLPSSCVMRSTACSLNFGILIMHFFFISLFLPFLSFFF